MFCVVIVWVGNVLWYWVQYWVGSNNWEFVDWIVILLTIENVVVGDYEVCVIVINVVGVMSAIVIVMVMV